jgi:hypothetical protein
LPWTPASSILPSRRSPDEALMRIRNTTPKKAAFHGARITDGAGRGEVSAVLVFSEVVS